jgi:hypothetical protein
MLLGVCLVFLCGVRPVCAESGQGSEPGENVRFVLMIQGGDADPHTFSIVSAGGHAQFDTIAGSVQKDGNSLPIILRFEAELTPLRGKEYLVSLVVSQSTPVAASAAASADGARRLSYQYQEIGAKSEVRMQLGQDLLFTQDPEKTVTLRLEAVE